VLLSLNNRFSVKAKICQDSFDDVLRLWKVGGSSSK